MFAAQALEPVLMEHAGEGMPHIMYRFEVRAPFLLDQHYKVIVMHCVVRPALVTG